MIEEITADALELLQAFGLDVDETDTQLPLLAASVEEELTALVNTQMLPGGLRRLAAERTAGRYLSWARLFAPDTLEGLDLTQAVAEIQEGDTDVVFSVDASQTAAAQLEDFLESLCSDRSGMIYRYRQLLW